jgi:hypothetical protein
MSGMGWAGFGLQLAFCVLDNCLEEIKSRIPEVTHSSIKFHLFT